MIVAAALVLVGYARTHSFVPGVGALRPAIVLTLLGVVAWLVDRRPERSLERLLDSSIVRAGLFVFAWAIVGVPFSMSLGGSSTFIIDNFSRTVLVFVIVVAAVRDFGDVRRLTGALALGAAVFSVMAPIERYTGGGAGGYDPNDGAMFMVASIPVLAFFVLHGRVLLFRIGAALAVFGAIGAVVTSQSRGGFLALAVMLGFMVITLKAIKPAARIAIVVLVLAATVPVASSEYWERVQTITEFDDGYGDTGIGGRRNTWMRGVNFTLSNPATGIGVGQFRRAEGQARGAAGFAARWRSAHSTWVEALAELGIPGFLAFISMFFFSARGLWRVQREDKRSDLPDPGREARALGAFLLASLVATVVAGSFLSHAYSGLTWGLLAIIAGYLKALTLSAAPPRHSRS